MGFSVPGKLVVYVVPEVGQFVVAEVPPATLTVAGGHGTVERPTAGMSKPAEPSIKSLRFMVTPDHQVGLEPHASAQRLLR